MSEAQHLADALEGLYANPENGWFMPITAACEGLTSLQAAAVPVPRFNSVWSVVNHVRLCNQFALYRLRGVPVDLEALGDAHWWPSPGDPRDERAWQEARECSRAAVQDLATCVAGFDDRELAEPVAPGQATRYQIIHGAIGHNSYHACEIISIRHLLGLWLENV